jgi:hypothetical protein
MGTTPVAGEIREAEREIDPFQEIKRAYVR